MSRFVQSILQEFESNQIVFIPGQRLSDLLVETEILLQVDTLMSDFIRILHIEGSFLVQEKSPKNEIILRRFTDEASANKFVSGRMEIYDKMWDGCGCKISYYS